MKILIVDDSTVVRKEIRHVLEPLHVIVEAADGIEGLAALRECSDIDLVLLDVNMPRCGGIEMLERMRTDACDVPVLLLTTEGHPSLIRRARNAGAKAWLVKPVPHEELRQLVDEFGRRVAKKEASA